MKRVHIPNMVLIGATNRNTGKTELACSLIRHLGQHHSVVGIKITAVTQGEKACPRGGEGCGVCALLTDPYEIILETRADGAKDTHRLRAAGADPVYWIKSFRSHMEEAIKDLLQRLDKGVVLVCESTGLRSVVQPGLFLLTYDDSPIKRPSAHALGHLADHRVRFRNGRLDFDVSRVFYVQDHWYYPIDSDSSPNSELAS